eukprot:scaffold162656_cov17-Prasinocladus_malaysianus.AAC.1
MNKQINQRLHKWVQCGHQKLHILITAALDRSTKDFIWLGWRQRGPHCAAAGLRVGLGALGTEPFVVGDLRQRWHQAVGVELRVAAVTQQDAHAILTLWQTATNVRTRSKRDCCG